MSTRKCKICGKNFYAKPSHIKNGWAKYCSQKCQYKGYQTGKLVKCDTCGKEIYRTQKELRCSKSKKFFCNRSCFAIWKNHYILFGENHPSWKNGQGSYRAIMMRANILPICCNCGIKDIRVLLTHHVDGDRKNNKIKNLKWLCRNCHYLIHNRKTI